MLIYLLMGLVVFHGAIHFIGFAKTFKEDNSTGLIKPVPGHQGWLWLLAGLLLILTAILMLLPGRQWLFSAFIGILLSQMLIIANWKAAKWGTLINLLILLALLFTVIARR